MHPFILFFDIDGVLHRRTTGTLRHAPALETLLARYPLAKLVISSHWRTTESLEDLRGWFSRPFASRIIDVTPVLSGGDRHGGRQREIEQWLARHPTAVWRALDDEAALYQPGCPWLITTDNNTGLDQHTLADLDAILARTFSTAPARNL